MFDIVRFCEKAVICEGCQTSYHLYCLASKVPPEATSAKCINCGNMIDLPDSGGDGASNARSCNGGGGRSGGEKRKRIAAVVDSDSEDSE